MCIVGGGGGVVRARMTDWSNSVDGQTDGRVKFQGGLIIVIGMK